MDENRQDHEPRPQEEGDWPPIVSTPVMSAVVLLLILPLVTILVVLWMWLSS